MTNHPEVYKATEDKKGAAQEVVVENVPDIVKEKTSVVSKLVSKNLTAKEKADAKKKAATEAKKAVAQAKEDKKAAAAAKKEAAKNTPKPAPCKAYVTIKERFQKEFFARLGVR